ncbi:MAG: phenol hydroxylase subunit P4 [Gammaproteobacteria bacterium]
MPVKALRDDYKFPAADAVENFHGNQLVYLGWDHHLLFCAPVAFPLPPEMPFGAFLEQIVPMAYSAHPDFEKIDWAAVTWKLNGEDFTPDPAASLKDNGIGHKAALRLRTPGLDGLSGSGA